MMMRLLFHILAMKYRHSTLHTRCSNQSSIVRFAECRLFDNACEPHISFSRDPNFSKDPRVKAAYKYFSKGEFDNKWPNWHDEIIVPASISSLNGKNCDDCSTSGILCDGLTPQCQNCAWKGKPCSFRFFELSYTINAQTRNQKKNYANENVEDFLSNAVVKKKKPQNSQKNQFMQSKISNEKNMQGELHPFKRHIQI